MKKLLVLFVMTILMFDQAKGMNNNNIPLVYTEEGKPAKISYSGFAKKTNDGEILIGSHCSTEVTNPPKSFLECKRSSFLGSNYNIEFGHSYLTTKGSSGTDQTRDSVSDKEKEMIENICIENHKILREKILKQKLTYVYLQENTLAGYILQKNQLNGKIIKIPKSYDFNQCLNAFPHLQEKIDSFLYQKKDSGNKSQIFDTDWVIEYGNGKIKIKIKPLEEPPKFILNDMQAYTENCSQHISHLQSEIDSNKILYKKRSKRLQAFVDSQSKQTAIKKMKKNEKQTYFITVNPINGCYNISFL